jgi:chemotaxis protein methyltransferase CheR
MRTNGSPDAGPRAGETVPAGAAPESSCAAFLQWALPRMGLAWQGFRRVRRQVCRRIGRRLQALRLGDLAAYRAHLAAHPEEWSVLDSFCVIPVSRLLRDRTVFEELGRLVLPALATAAARRDEHGVRCWSAGCASGEEPYSLSLVWRLELATRFPSVALQVLATDVDEQLLERARHARYARSSLHEVPAAWIEAGFDRRGGLFVVRPDVRAAVEFVRQDIRRAAPPGPFDLVLCRNMAFTYFDAAGQRRALATMLDVLRTGGALVIGSRERLPGDTAGLDPWVAELGIFRRSARPQLPLDLAAAAEARPWN